ncbi:unnamed protein product [Protopolystoma xenopodis]|uniref:Uncharacterized protein n=1 Tax=Protopolystoma xenopodis TaxID=117903 RepID=A0A448WL82_9PLAT|nr:unnamed protein product [Protopolystoma xenopodis]
MMDESLPLFTGTERDYLGNSVRMNVPVKPTTAGQDESAVVFIRHSNNWKERRGEIRVLFGSADAVLATSPEQSERCHALFQVLEAIQLGSAATCVGLKRLHVPDARTRKSWSESRRGFEHWCAEANDPLQWLRNEKVKSGTSWVRIALLAKLPGSRCRVGFRPSPAPSGVGEKAGNGPGK